MATITIIDPVTRIEGHMGVDVTIEGGEVVDARCTGTLFRGFEAILNGREPWDAPVITQRICGVCPIAHGQAAVKALDDVARVVITDNGRILRNLTLGANFVQSHILHFYLLTAVDYLKGPQTAPWVPAWDVDMRSHPGLDAALGHLTTAIEARRRAHEMGAITGGRMPTSHTFIPGGFTATPSAANIEAFRSDLAWLIDFIRNVYIPDVQAVGTVYSDYFAIGGGHANLLAYGVFNLDANGQTKLLGRGRAVAGAAGASLPLDPAMITEAVTHSWYDDAAADLHPASGATSPSYPKAGAYSWLKAPRYEGAPYEVGALARMWVNGDYQNGVSVMDRHVARALECLKVAEAMMGWLDEYAPGQPVYRNGGMPSAGAGVGLTEAPRGALGHWVELSNGRISHYQIITPTCWNASPMDGNDVKGPIEEALIGTPVEDPNRPIEVLRVIHSFDPCLSCAVHIIRPKGKPLVVSAGLSC